MERGDCIVKKLVFDGNEAAIYNFAKEASTMRQIKPHPNVVALFGVCLKPGNPQCLVMEYVPGKIYLINSVTITKEEHCGIMYCIISLI